MQSSMSFINSKKYNLPNLVVPQTDRKRGATHNFGTPHIDIYCSGRYDEKRRSKLCEKLSFLISTCFMSSRSPPFFTNPGPLLEICEKTPSPSTIRHISCLLVTYIIKKIRNKYVCVHFKRANFVDFTTYPKLIDKILITIISIIGIIVQIYSNFWFGKIILLLNLFFKYNYN